jgi:protein-disulfide isomerase
MDNSNKFTIPGAIVIAGLIIAGAIYYNKDGSTSQPEKSSQEKEPQTAQIPPSSPIENIAPISDKDHILGNPEAQVSIITFTDFECPFCKRFHLTMKQIMEDYGKTGKIKWVLRHFPLEQLHSKAKNEAIASECAAELGGNEKFWQYVDRIFEITPGNDGLDLAELPKIAEHISLNKTQFENCLKSGKFDQRIKENIENAIKSGALGTPYSIIIGQKGEKAVIPGALPYESVKEEIDKMLNVL